MISFITDSHKVFDISPSNYWSYVENTLNNPADIWSHAFDNQLDENSRAIVSLVVFNGKEIQEHNLKEAFLYLANRGNIDSPEYGISEFYSSVKLAVGALVNRKIREGSSNVSYDLFNPAVGDYLIRRFSEDQNRLCILFESLSTKESLGNITSLLKSEIVQSSIMHSVITKLMFGCLTGKIRNKTTEYKINLIRLSIDQIYFNPELQKLLNKWLISLNYEDIEADYYPELSEVLTWSLQNNIIDTNEIDFDKYFELSLNETLAHSGFVSFSNLFKELGTDFIKKYSNKFKKLIIEYWRDMLDENISSDGILNDYYDDEEESAARESLYQYVSYNLSEYVIEFDDEDIDSICEYCDVWQHIEDNRENASHEPDYYESARDSGYSSISEDTAIDDLFERTER